MPPMDTNQANINGPDASSIKPVSSLRSRFENLNKAEDAPPPHHPKPQPAQTAQHVEKPQTTIRPISPRPKPDRLREFKPVHDGPIVAPITPTTSFPKTTYYKNPPPLPAEGSEVSPTTPWIRPPSRTSTQQVSVQPPAVTVEPPQSPPKGVSPSVTRGDQSPFLNPDAIATPTASGGSPKSDNAPSRPVTPMPALPPPRSPRLASSSGPPSPPPPRRSGEILREKQAPPPPAPRGLKSTVQAPQLNLGLSPKPNTRKLDISDDLSPFNSPPSSPDKLDDETPPDLPTRPRPQAERAQSRAMPVLGGFDPPPTHHAVASKRRGLDVNGSTRDHVTPQLNGEERPALPARPHLSTPADNSRLPRSNNLSLSQGEILSPITTEKRVTSNPTQSLTAPADKTHTRSKTMDRPTTTRPPIDIRPTQAAQSSTKSAHPSTPMSVSPVKELSIPAPAFPDNTSSNRKPPFNKKGVYEIHAKYDPRILDVCADYVCSSGHLTRVWSANGGEILLTLPHAEDGVKGTAVAFKPGQTANEEGSKIWVGTNNGDIIEIDIASGAVAQARTGVHGRSEVIRIHRHYNELWSLDDAGTLHVWGPDADGVPNIARAPAQTFKTPRGHTFSMVVGSELWHATGREIRVFSPTLDGRAQFQVLVRPITAEGATEITSGTLVRTQPGKVFFGHADGKISVFGTSDYSYLGATSISNWKINALAGVGQYLWVAYNTGMICVYDTSRTPWVVLKEWQAHDNPVLSLKTDLASPYRLGKFQVLSLGADSRIRIWDGLLQDDWLEDEMKSNDTTYCDFDEIKALVFTWNAGASTPHSLRYSGNDGTFFQELIQSSELPDILIFGFQELVDLEDKAATAKRLLKGNKRKEGADQERMSHQYRDWRDFLMKILDDYTPAEELYHLLHSAPLVGLFTCIFVKSSLRARIRNLSASEVKRGMGGVYGNKGAVVIRFQVDDSSLCFINCHLAAGQTQSQSRHNDITAILEANSFPAERDSDTRIDRYAGGGDGSMVLDHELCILNGDLNYRIDTMSRDTVVGAVRQGNLSKLLDRDQLLVARRRNPAFKLRAWEELPISFNPTYKYDVGTDRYDTSEKRRSPAWCDRILFRGRGRVQQLDYQRHEIRVSDHRPVTGSFRLWVKKIDPKRRATVWTEAQQSFDAVRQGEIASEKLYYLKSVCGYDEATALQLIDRASRKSSRSASRNRSIY